MKRGVRTWWCVAVLAFLLQACQHKELCMDHSGLVDVEIVFDWSGAPDASPRTMVVQFFRVDGRSYRRSEFTPSAGGSIERGKVRLEPGEYKILFHNGEVEGVEERGETYDGYELFTVPRSLLSPMGRGGMDMPPRPHGAEEQPVRATAGRVWGGHREYLEVQEVPGQSVTLSPLEVTMKCTVEVRNVKNLSDGVDVSGALTGMAEGWRLSEGVPSGVPVTMPMAMRRVDSHTLEASFLFFGHCPARREKHVFSLYTSGKNFFNFDVTDQMHDTELNPDPTRILVVIDEEVDFPSPKPDGGGMSPSVDEWEEVIIDIEV